jgi:hypothetical protein
MAIFLHIMSKQIQFGGFKRDGLNGQSKTFIWVTFSPSTILFLVIINHQNPISIYLCV